MRERNQTHSLMTTATAQSHPNIAFIKFTLAKLDCIDGEVLFTNPRLSWNGLGVMSVPITRIT